MAEGKIPTKEYHFPKKPQKMEYSDDWKWQDEAREKRENERVLERKKLLDKLGDNPEDKLLKMIFVFDKSNLFDQDFIRERRKENKYADKKELEEYWTKYDKKSLCLDLLSEMGTRKALEYTVGFIEKDEASSFNYREQVEKILSSIDKEFAQEKLSELLKSDKEGVRERAKYFLKKMADPEKLDDVKTDLPNEMSESDKTRLDEFFRRYGVDGLKCFSLLKREKGIGKKILDVGLEKHLAHGEAYMIFAKVAEIIGVTEKELANLKIKNDPDTNKVRSKLLERASDIITDFFRHDVNDIEAVMKLLRNLEESKTEMIMLAALLKTVKENKEKIDFETIKNLALSKRVMGERNEQGEEVGLSGEEKEAMLKMVEKNYREVVFPDNKEAAEAVIADFKKELEEGFSGQIVYSLKFQNQLVAFCRFQKLSDTEVYAGSLNVDQEVNNLCLGKYFTNSVLSEVAKNYRIKAITRVNNPAITLYEKQGFIIDREHPFSKYGEQYYNMTMKKKI